MEFKPDTTSVHVENIETPLTRERVVHLLTKYPDNIKPYIEYIQKREQEVQIASDSLEETEKKTFTFLLEQAEILRDAGLLEQAADAYNDAADMAEAKGMDAEYDAILAELSKI